MGHRSQKMTDLKVLICGDGAIGKTCFLDTRCEKGCVDWEAPEYKPTAADNLQRNWCDADDKDWEVNLWDTAGQEALVNLRRNAYPGTEILLIGFDMTKSVTLDNIQSWVDEVAETEPNIGATILIGTKADWYEDLVEGKKGKGADGLPLKTMEEMYEKAVSIGAAAFVCTSAKNGYGLLEMAEEGPAKDAESDTMSLQGDANYLDLQIMRCGSLVKSGGCIAALESRAQAAPAPVVEEKKPEKPKAPEEPKPAAPVQPKPAKPEKIKDPD